MACLRLQLLQLKTMRKYYIGEYAWWHAGFEQRLDQSLQSNGHVRHLDHKR